VTGIADLDKNQLCLGVIVGAQGVRGEVRIKPFTAEPEDVGAYGPVSNAPGTRSFDISVLRIAKGLVIAKLKGVNDRNEAEILKGTELFTDRSKLPEPEDENTFYHADLVGLRVDDSEGTVVGHVAAVFDHGAGDVIDIRCATEGRLISLPFTRAVFPKVDVVSGVLVVDMPDGVITDESPEGDKK